MYRTLSCFLIIIFTISAVAAPSSPLKKKRSFKVPSVRQRYYVPDGIAALRKAYGKFGIGTLGALPDGKFASGPVFANKTGTSSGDEQRLAPSHNEVQFLAPVSVGGQYLVMNIDSGSSDMWVFHTGLTVDTQRDRKVYDQNKSQTAIEMPGFSFKATYGDGSFASGPVITETVDIGGATVERQAVGIPDSVSAAFSLDPNSNGLIGLGFSSINTMLPEQQKTFFDNILPDLPEPVFTASLKPGAAGSYEFGRIDRTKFQGPLSSVPVDSSRGFWEFSSQQFAIGNGSTQTKSSGTPSLIADTGTSLMLMDDEIVQAYYAKVVEATQSQTAGGFVFPCAAQLPDLKVEVGDDHLAVVSGRLMNFAPAGTDRQGQRVCFGGLQSNSGAPLQILGDIFFKSQFVVFNGSDPPSLAVAPHA